MVPELPLPDVPAVDEPGVLDEVEPVLPELALGLLLVLPVVLLDDPDPIRALVSMNWPLPDRALLAVELAVPLVPVAPDVPLAPPPCRHPVTVIARLLPEVEVWLPVVEPACADMLTAQPSAITNVAPVHTLFMRYLPKDTRGLCAITTPCEQAGMISIPDEDDPDEPWRSFLAPFAIATGLNRTAAGSTLDANADSGTCG